MSKVPRSFVRQANTQAAVKFQPELDALKYILQAAQATKHEDVRNARAGAQFLIQAAAAARPALIDGYKRLGMTTGMALQQYANDTNHVASAADQPSGGIRDEARIAADNLNLSAQAALSMLAQTETRAAAESNYQVQAANQTYQQARDQVAQRASDIAGQSGTYASGVLGTLLGDQRDRSFKAHQNALDRQATAGKANDSYYQKYGISRKQFLSLSPSQRRALIHKSGKGSSGGTLPGGAKPLPISQQNTIISQIGEAKSWIEQLAQSQHMSSHDIRQHLIRGDTLTDASGNKLKLPKLPKLAVNAGYDIADPKLGGKGGLSRANVVALHKAGVRIKGRLPIIVPTAQQLGPMAGVFGGTLATQ